MESFSRRMGLKPKKAFQVESMDEELRTGLWNEIYNIYFKDYSDDRIGYHTIKKLTESIWIEFLKERIDEIEFELGDRIEEISVHYFNCKWNNIYDFIEFLSNYENVSNRRKNFILRCNKTLKKENSAYRFVGNRIVRITSDEEIQEIEDVLVNTDPFKPVQTHIETALMHLSNREKPDYRNSIKESISAVESICKMIANKPNATLGDALKTLDGKIALHPALQEAFVKLYGYTNDAEGIRHALMDESTLDLEDAKFMLVSCSAFINYLIVKSEKAGIELIM